VSTHRDFHHEYARYVEDNPPEPSRPLVYGARVQLVEGTGRRVLIGSFAEEVSESLDVAISWVIANCDKILTLFRKCRARSRPGGARKQLFAPEQDLEVYLGALDSPQDASAAASLALSLAASLTGRDFPKLTAVCGSLNLRGTLLPTGGVVGRIRAAKNAGMEMLIMPSAAIQGLTPEDLPHDLRDYARHALRGAHDMRDALIAAFFESESAPCPGGEHA
jgi:ATP-dependent Lon protease